MKRINLISLVLMLWGMSVVVYAQPPTDGTTLPTVTALAEADVPARDRLQLAQQILGISVSTEAVTAPVAYAVGNRKTFIATNTDASQLYTLEAELKAKGDHIYIWVDVRASITTTQADILASAFDATIYPQVRDLWGSEASPGIDGDPRVYALFTYGLGSSIAAYFSGENSYPPEIAPSSNAHEMFLYEIRNIGNAIGAESVQSVTAHEFQHMIRANVNPNPETWFNEGLSTFTQWYMGYDDVAWMASAYLRAAPTQLNTWGRHGDTSAHYGASLLWTTYFYQRFGLKALQTVSQSPAVALDGFDAILQTEDGHGIEGIFADWVLANAWRDPTLADGRYGYTGGEFSTINPQIHTLDQYPKTLTETQPQYSAQYYDLAQLPATGTLTLTLDAPPTVRMIPTDAPSGSMLWYSNNRDNSAPTLTRAFDLSDVTHATLTYNVWYSLEPHWDYAYVMASIDDGATWTPLQTARMTADNPLGVSYGVGYTGESDTWHAESIDLSAYAGQTVQIRFIAITDDAVTHHGVALDDIAVAEIGYHSDFEADSGGWQAAGWARIDNRLPQSVWVQVSQQSADDFSVTRQLYTADTTAPLTVPLVRGHERVVLAISPLAPYTTLPTDYTLTVALSE